jgi:hypothetical protein
MRLGILILIITTGVTMAGSVFAYDNHRKGWVLGLGAGGGMYADQGNRHSDKVLSLRISAGWGFGERNIVSVDRQATFAKGWNGSLYMDQTLGIDWQHYWGKPAKLFSVLGVAAMDNEGTQYDITAGLGYEFAKHVAVSLSHVATRFSGGRLLDRDLLEVHLWYMWY